MPFWKHLMWPLALIWGLVSTIRNWLYDIEFLNGAEFEVPVISIGNLSMGGSGKTPHTEYFLYHFREQFKIAVLSRGYRRNSSGFKIALPNDDFTHIGDEPRQIKAKFGDITVAVGESRALAIPAIMQAKPLTNLIILDDAYQHRSVKPALSVLLTPFDLPFWKDNLFPVGWLRETKNNFQRADIIIITKCDSDFNVETERKILEEFKPLKRQKVFFTTFRYGTPYQLFNPNNRISIDKETSVLLFSGIANGINLHNFLKSVSKEVFWIEYDDHYNYQQNDLIRMQEAYQNIGDSKKVILTTEKDAVRIEPYMQWIQSQGIEVFCLPITVEFIGSNKDEFNNLVLDFIEFFKNPSK